LVTAVAAPGTPAAGKGSVYVDSTSKALAVKTDAGLVSHTVQTIGGVASQWLTSVNDAGAWGRTQPAFTDISGTLASSQFGPLTGDVTTSGYAATLATVTIGKGGTGQTSAGAAFDALNQSSFSIAAAATTDLSTVSGPFGTLTGSGSVTVTSFGTVAAGVSKKLRVGAGLAVGLTHNVTSMVCPGGATGVVGNAGDMIEVVSLGSGNWQVVAVNNVNIWCGINATAGASGIMCAGVLALQFGAGITISQNAIRANSAAAAGTPQFTYQSDTTSGSYLVSAGNVGHSASSTLQCTVTANGLTHQTRHQTGLGATVASANTITLGNDGNVFPISGTTTIKTITTTNWQSGSTVRLVFAGALTVDNTGNITFRAGAASIATAANDIRDFTWDGAKWRCGA
jgi:hypothetical protein